MSVSARADAGRGSWPPVFDGHIHAAGALGTPEGLRALLDRGALGQPVRRAVIMASPVLGAGARYIPPIYHRTVGTWRLGQRLSWRVLGSRRFARTTRCEPDNHLVAHLAAALPERVVPFAFLDPNVPDPVAEARRWVEDTGFRGIKLHGWFHRTPLLAEGVRALAEYAGARQIPLLLHPGLTLDATHDLDLLARNCPATPFIVAHLDPEAVPVAARRENVFLDTSGLCMTPRHLAIALREAGASKLIFGSDSPAETGGDLAYSLRLLQQAQLPDGDLERICWSNLAGLLRA